MTPIPLVALALVRLQAVKQNSAQRAVDSPDEQFNAFIAKHKAGLHQGEHLPLLLALHANNQTELKKAARATPEHRRCRSTADAVDTFIAAAARPHHSEVDRTFRRTVHVPSISPPVSPFLARQELVKKASTPKEDLRHLTVAELAARAVTQKAMGTMITSPAESEESVRSTSRRIAGKNPSPQARSLRVRVNQAAAGHGVGLDARATGGRAQLPDITSSSASSAAAGARGEQLGTPKRRDRAITVDSLHSLQRQNSLRIPDEFCQKENDTSRYCYYPASLQAPADERTGTEQSKRDAAEAAAGGASPPGSSSPATAAGFTASSAAPPVASLQETFVRHISDLEQNVPLHSFSSQPPVPKTGSRSPPRD